MRSSASATQAPARPSSAEVARVARERAPVARQVPGQRGESDRDGLALAARVDEGEREERLDGVVEVVRSVVAFGSEKRDTSSARPTFRSELASWITARLRSGGSSPSSSASSYSRTASCSCPVESSADARSNAATAGGSFVAKLSMRARNVASSSSLNDAQSSSTSFSRDSVTPAPQASSVAAKSKRVPTLF